MKPTLQERLQQDAWEQYKLDGKYKEVTKYDLDQIILHTIEQTIKEGCEVIEDLLENCPAMNYEEDNYDAGRIHALTDTQHALRGIIK